MLYWTLKRVLLGPLLRVLFRPWVEGGEHVAAEFAAVGARRSRVQESAEGGNRAANEEVAAEFADKFPQVELLTVDEVFGGWDKVESEHLASGGILDQVFTNQ